MVASITLEQLWFNHTILDFFFRKQARETLEELVERVGGRKSEEKFNELAERIEDVYVGDLDVFEEDCYNASVEQLMDALGYFEEN